MNPMIVTMLGSLLRAVLLAVFGTLIEKGIWTEGQVEQLAIGLTGFLVVWGWALWKHYRSRLKFLTALELPAGTTEEAVTEKLKLGLGAKLPMWLVAAFLVPAIALTPGCGPKTKPTLVKVDSAVYQSIRAIHDTAVVLGDAKVITPQQELQIQEAILPVAQLGEQASKVLLAWKSGPTPPELQRLVQEMGKLVQRIVAILPMDSPGKAALLEKVALAQQAIASVLVIMGGAL